MTSAEARFNIALRPQKPEGSLGWTAQDGNLSSHTAPELCGQQTLLFMLKFVFNAKFLQIVFGILYSCDKKYFIGALFLY